MNEERESSADQVKPGPLGLRFGIEFARLMRLPSEFRFDHLLNSPGMLDAQACPNRQMVGGLHCK